MWTIKMLGVSQTLMHIHGSVEFNRGPHPDDPELILSAQTRRVPANIA
jgi:hypothetical protein